MSLQAARPRDASPVAPLPSRTTGAHGRAPVFDRPWIPIIRGLHSTAMPPGVLPWPEERFRELTPAQRQIAAILSAGYSGTEIAINRRVKRALVDAQVAETLAMLQARGPSELRAIAARRIGRLPPEAGERDAPIAANEDPRTIARQLRRESAALHDQADRLRALADRIEGSETC